MNERFISIVLSIIILPQSVGNSQKFEINETKTGVSSTLGIFYALHDCFCDNITDFTTNSWLLNSCYSLTIS